MSLGLGHGPAPIPVSGGDAHKLGAIATNGGDKAIVTAKELQTDALKSGKYGEYVDANEAADYAKGLGLEDAALTAKVAGAVANSGTCKEDVVDFDMTSFRLNIVKTDFPAAQVKFPEVYR